MVCLDWDPHYKLFCVLSASSPIKVRGIDDYKIVDVMLQKGGHDHKNIHADQVTIIRGRLYHLRIRVYIQKCHQECR
jgi:hypothetical protein